MILTCQSLCFGRATEKGYGARQWNAKGDLRVFSVLKGGARSSSWTRGWGQSRKWYSLPAYLQANAISLIELYWWGLGKGWVWRRANFTKERRRSFEEKPIRMCIERLPLLHCYLWQQMLKMMNGRGKRQHSNVFIDDIYSTWPSSCAPGHTIRPHCNLQAAKHGSNMESAQQTTEL